MHCFFQEFVLKKLVARKKIGKVGKAQIKISIILIYYTVLGVVGLVSLTYFEVKIFNSEGLREFFLCESLGNPDCFLDVAPIKNIKALSVSVIVMLSFLPVIVLIFSFDYQACKKKLKSVRKSKTVSSRVYTTHGQTSSFQMKNFKK